MEASATYGSLVEMVSAPERNRRAQALWALTLTACATWTVLTFGGAGDYISIGIDTVEWLIFLAPVAVLLMVLAARPHSPPYLKVALVWTVTVAAAIRTPGLVDDNLYYFAAPAVLAVAVLAALRWPVPTLLVGFALSGAFNTLEAFTPLQAGPMADLVLGGAWISLVYTWLSGRRSPPAVLPPALLLFGAYIAVTLVFALAGEDLQRSLYSFRSSAWLMTAVLLVPLLGYERERRLLLHRGVLVIGALVGAYAMLRWAIGPADKEAAPAEQAGRYVTNDLGELRLIGSFPSPQALAVWCSVMAPFALASTLAPIGTVWRLLAAFTTGSCGAALFAADVRFGMVAAAGGAITVLVLFAVGRGFAGRRALPLASVTLLIAIGAGVFVATKLDAEGSSGERFRSLVTAPLEDSSVQARFIKWQTILAEADDQPFGRGLGASGAAHVKYARFNSAASFDPDSSYVKVAYDQGFTVLVLFAVALLALGVALARRSLDTSDPVAAALALGACGTLAAHVIDMSGAVYFEGMGALAPWILIGLGFAPFLGPGRRTARASR